MGRAPSLISWRSRVQSRHFSFFLSFMTAVNVLPIALSFTCTVYACMYVIAAGSSRGVDWVPVLYEVCWSPAGVPSAETDRGARLP